MIRLEFKGSSALQSTALGPADHYRVSGNFIRNADSGQILARYHNHFWDVNGQHYTSYECKSPLTVYFEDFEGGQSEIYGPYDGVYVADGSMYAADRLIAKFVDQTLLWHDHESDTFWPHLILAAP